jgi:hypothetical protein
MNSKKIYWKSALDLIEKGENIENIVVDFRSEKILWDKAMIFGKKGIVVPDDLIEYDDDNIDYTDSPAITQEDIDTGKIKWIYKADIPIKKEINDWIKHEKIDMNKLLTDLVENFYQTIKNINKNAAL